MRFILQPCLIVSYKQVHTNEFHTSKFMQTSFIQASSYKRVSYKQVHTNEFHTSKFIQASSYKQVHTNEFHTSNCSILPITFHTSKYNLSNIPRLLEHTQQVLQNENICIKLFCSYLSYYVFPLILFFISPLAPGKISIASCSLSCLCLSLSVSVCLCLSLSGFVCLPISCLPISHSLDTVLNFYQQHIKIWIFGL